jgi:hypothetical protein
MPKIAGGVETHTVDPTQCADLPDFSCGDGRLGAESVVNRIVQSYGAGKHPDNTVRVTREVLTGKLVGVTAFERGGYRHPALAGKEYANPFYLAVLSLEAAYRNGFTDEQGTPISRLLLIDALEQISYQGGPPMPSVQTVIDRENKRSWALAEAYGFELAFEQGNRLYVRPEGLPIDEEPEK